MNCCDEYGDCRQGDDCPARTGVVLAHQAACARRVARIKSSTPKFSSVVPPEAGNFRVVDLGPDDIDQPLTPAENAAMVRTLLGWLLAVLGAVGAVAFAVGFATERWSDLLWTYLASRS